VPLSFEQRKVFFEKCSEAEVTSSRSKHLDPILCLGPRWNMMINDNIDVHNGIANGTTAEFVSLSQTGAKLVPIQMFGYWVYSVTVDEVDQSLSGKIMTDSRANSVLTLPKVCTKLSFQ
jgi:hypothetical protein